MKNLHFIASAALTLCFAFSVWLTYLAKLATTFVTALLTPVRSDNGLRVPLVLELFTLKGCSSYLPAPAWLRQLDQQAPVPGVESSVLSEHVAYGNSPGWADPLSAEIFSARQEAYAQALRRAGGNGGRLYAADGNG